MALIKQPISINFLKGLDTKADPYQVALGNFLSLQNSIFTAAGRLTKRNGFSNITKLTNSNQTTLTTLNDNLIATGSNLYAFSADSNQWLSKGTVQPISLSTQPLIRSSTSQVSPDSAIASNGLICLAYVDTSLAYYQISDSVTGEQVISRVALPSTAKSPRVFIVGPYFIVTFIATVGGNPHLQFISIPTAKPSNPSNATDFSTNVSGLTAGYDGYSLNNQLYLAWHGGGNTVKIAYLTSSLGISVVTTIASSDADIMTVTPDILSNRIFIAFWDAGSTNGYSIAFDYSLNQVMAKTQIITTQTLSTITSYASNRIQTVFYQIVNNYNTSPSTDPNTARTDYISKITVTLPNSGVGVGTVGSASIILRSVGLASKALIDSMGTIYMLVAYGPAATSNQPSYFLIDSLGNVYMRLAYSNGGGYAASQVLPSVISSNSSFFVPYLMTDFLTTVNKGTNLPANTQVNAIYTQTGINLATFTLDEAKQYSAEIAGALHLTGGQLWEYDSVKPVEHGFQVWPENLSVTTSASGGLLTAQTYYYQFVYEWTDNQGNLHRSAPSIPIKQVTTGSTSSNTIYVPTLRLTYKISPNPIRIVGYRWSAAQQVYYQFTSLTSPTINDTTVDYVTIIDTLADSSILGTTLLYTTGGVIENIAAPASIASALFNNRLFLIDAEDRNLLWFSKQVIENVPVEMSDLLTLYVAPTSGAQGSTGPMKALGAMDDKLIIFKKDAIYYINGSGPDNTGANSSFSDPVFITSSVGCANPNSIILMPNGIMFQSDKGIWILGRDLSTEYIGAPVEQYNSSAVLSASVIPGTNQVRFILINNITLMYDYFYKQWSTHTNVLAISGTLYQSAHTYLNSLGQVYQETPGTYLDGSSPVLLALTTSWINIAGIQGYERFYFGNLLGTYYTPFKLNVSLAYDYNPSPIKAITVVPDNYSPVYGAENNWGSGGSWGGGPGNVFSARFFPVKQKCESFQVSIQEVYDPSLGQAAGQGLSLSGLALIVGTKKGYRTQSAKKSFG